MQSLEMKKFLVYNDILYNVSIIRKVNNFENLGYSINDKLREKEENALKFFSDSSKRVYVKEGIKLNNSLYQKNKRLKTRIENYFKCCDFNVFRPIFATYTISPKYIDLKKETLIRYLKRSLKDTCLCYVANADYGKKNDRLHFHALIVSEYNFNEIRKSWPYGAVQCETAYCNSSCLSKYITKLTNHALKESTKPLENKLIYSRGIAFD